MVSPSLHRAPPLAFLPILPPKLPEPVLPSQDPIIRLESPTKSDQDLPRTVRSPASGRSDSPDCRQCRPRPLHDLQRAHLRIPRPRGEEVA